MAKDKSSNTTTITEDKKKVFNTEIRDESGTSKDKKGPKVGKDKK